MKNAILFVGAILGGIIGGAIAQAIGANSIGFLPVGTFTNGQCLQIQASGATNGVVGVPCPTPPALAIGVTVSGATVNSALSVDANGHLAQINALTAN